MTSPTLDIFLAELCGQSEAHLMREPESGFLMHSRVIEPFIELRAEARAAGFDLAIASSFRSFERQCLIWNDKANGRRPVLDDAGRPLDISQWDDLDKVLAILRFSALPGASRHHWGSDLDVFDRSALAPDGRPQLTSAECEAGGPFYALHQWLDGYLPSSGFYRPFAMDRGGVAREPWHISFASVAQQYEDALTLECLRSLLSRSSFALSEAVLAHLDEIYPRFIAPLPRPGP